MAEWLFSRSGVGSSGLNNPQYDFNNTFADVNALPPQDNSECGSDKSAIHSYDGNGWDGAYSSESDAETLSTILNVHPHTQGEAS